MKGLPRLLRLMPLLLVAIVCTGGPGPGAAMGKKAAAQLPQRRLPPGSPEILEFTATPTSVVRGGEAVLRWRVINAQHIWLARSARPEDTDCIKEESGEMRVTPDRDTTYNLNVWAGSMHVLKGVTVAVVAPSGVCTISGVVSNDRREYGTRVELYPFHSDRPLFSTAVDVRGRYQFLNVPEGDYRVRPRGNYPQTREFIGPMPASRDVHCQPNGSHRADFRIGSNEG